MFACVRYKQAIWVTVHLSVKASSNCVFMRHHFALGAVEVWLVSEAGEIRYFDKTGPRPNSAFGVEVTLPSLPEQ